MIPNYKRVEELKRALQSIIDQKNFEELVDKIIIVDDKSENVKLIDDTISLLNNNKILHIKIISNQMLLILVTKVLNVQKLNGYVF